MESLGQIFLFYLTEACLTLVWCSGLWNSFTFFIKRKYTRPIFFQTQTHWPWLIFWEEPLSEDIFNDHSLTVHPLHIYITHRMFWSMDPGLISEWKFEVMCSFTLSYNCLGLLLICVCVFMCVCVCVCVCVRERERERVWKSVCVCKCELGNWKVCFCPCHFRTGL